LSVIGILYRPPYPAGINLVDTLELVNPSQIALLALILGNGLGFFLPVCGCPQGIALAVYPLVIDCMFSITE